MAERKLLGEGLAIDERIVLAQLTTQPGWRIFVKIMAEACRAATEEVIRLDPSTDRYQDKVVALQTTARAMNKFSAEILDSMRVHTNRVVNQHNEKENPPERPTRFQGFKPPEKPKVVQVNEPPTEAK